jgi:hypothetical protein
MATSLQCDVSAAVRWTFSTTDGDDARQIVDANTLSLIDSLANGTALDQANNILHGQSDVPVATPLSIDLAGTLKDSFGNTVTMTKVKCVMISNSGSGSIALTGGFIAYLLGDADADMTLPSGAAFMIWNPTLAAYTVTAGTGDTITITASGATATVDYVVIGVA